MRRTAKYDLLVLMLSVGQVTAGYWKITALIVGQPGTRTGKIVAVEEKNAVHIANKCLPLSQVTRTWLKSE